MTEEGWYTICGNKVDKLRQVQFVYKYNNKFVCYEYIITMSCVFIQYKLGILLRGLGLSKLPSALVMASNAPLLHSNINY